MATPNNCPCCGHPLPYEPIKGMKMSRMEKRIFEIVQKRTPHGITSADLLDYVYAEDPNGGPEYPDISLKTTICRFNKKLGQFGYRIKAHPGRHSEGYTLHASH